MRYAWLLAVVACVVCAGVAPAAVPVAGFSANVTSGAAPLAVSFTDSSTNSPTAWAWSFGDGGSSTAQNPSHTFAAPRAYSVSLTVSNASGTDTETKSFYISVFGSGTTYYVATNGNDNDPGTEAQPFATIQKGLDMVTAGGTVIVQDGTYSQAPQNWAVGAVRCTGTASDPIVIRAAHKLGAVIDAQNLITRGFYICGKGDGCAQGAQYVTIQGFEIKNCWLPSSTSGSGIDLDGYANHCVIRDNYIHDVARFVDTDTTGNDGSYEDQRCSYNTWDSNVITRCGRLSGGSNYFDHGLYVCGDYGTIINNTIYDNDWGWQIQVAGYYDTVDHLLISNNTFSGGAHVGQIVIWGAVNNSTIQNNIFSSICAGRTAIEYSSARRNSNDLIRYNLTYGGNGIGPANSGWTYSNNITGDPLFVDAANKDFHLTSGSPAKDAGTATSAFPIDQDGLTRPMGTAYDMGAFEYVATSGGGGSAPVANFSGNPTSGLAPLNVAFTDLSTNSPTAWSWTFGDGGTSTAQNPTHQYAVGTFTVSLTATNAYGQNTNTKTNYITATSGSGGDFSCASTSIVQGSLVSGDHTSTHVSDDSYYKVASVKAAQNKYWIEENYNFTTGLSGLSSLSYSWEAHNEINLNGIDYTIKAYDYTTSTWDSVGTWTITGTTDVTYSNTIASPANYVSGGVVQLKIVASKGQTWNLAVDFLKITAQP